MSEQETPSPDPATALLADACHLRIPSQPDWIGPTVDYLVQRATRIGAVEAGRDCKLMIALHEALTNAIIHGNLGISSELKERGDDEFFTAVAERMADPARARRVVDIQASYDGRSATWVIHDQGSGFDSQAALRKLDEEPDLYKPSGRGLLLIRAFTDAMRYDDGGRRLVLELRRPGDDRRRQPRWATAQAVQVTALGADGRPEGGERGAVVCNASQGGAAFLADGMAAGQRVRLTIPGERPVEVMAEVRHCQTAGGNVVEVGCRFETPLAWPLDPPDSEAGKLGELLARLVGGQPPPDERRSAPRVSFGGRVEVELPGGVVRRGFGRDLSRGGIAFLCAGAVPLEVVRLRLWAGEGGPVEVQARVVRATRLVEEFYDIAAQFVPG